MSPYSVFCHAYLPISHLAPLNWLNIMPLCPFLCVSVKSPLDSIPEPSFTSHFCWIFKPLWRLCLLQAGTACTLRQIGCPLRPVQRNWERTAVAFLLHSAAPALGRTYHQAADGGQASSLWWWKGEDWEPEPMEAGVSKDALVVWKKKQGKKVGSSKSSPTVKTSIFSAVRDSFYLGGSCSVATNESSCFVASQQHNYLIYQWKLWGNEESLLESRSAILPGRLCFSSTHQKTWYIFERCTTKYIMHPDLLNHEDLDAGGTKLCRASLCFQWSLFSWVPLSMSDSSWATFTVRQKGSWPQCEGTLELCQGGT